MKRIIPNQKQLLLFVLCVAVVLFCMDYEQNSLWSNDNINKPIQIREISTTKMQKAVYTSDGDGARIKFEDIDLTHDEILRIVQWINLSPKADISKLVAVPANISMGIVIRMKSKREVRIQYNLESIFITKIDAIKGQVQYSIKQPKLKEYFDQHLKGFYFGQDMVKKL
ncbi:hypothetical protein ACFO9Q_11200 [Paenibacillus sp. GCM10023252]|uniref:hypothetical protein n=1 Tax=Paenibacillus sp. GCM10023252 TaxID=3252649 RepID=UPI00361D5D56